MNAEQMRKHAAKVIMADGSAAEWARRHGFSRAYVSAVLTGKTMPSDRLLDALGLERKEVTFRRKK